MKTIKQTLNESGLAVYEELAANHVDPMECYSLGYKYKGECFHNMTKEFMFKEGAVVFLVFVINNEICNSGNFLLGGHFYIPY